jgi:hypothetical protein
MWSIDLGETSQSSRFIEELRRKEATFRWKFSFPASLVPAVLDVYSQVGKKSVKKLLFRLITKYLPVSIL